ncbi:anchored repeat-type ABC transporter ATP-binding subunit [Nesterenkonia haasae]|uniref:anchored repeat-type ABC transporter ATP-binding subunit n=1 Tax=Nesterenkonia haasae TaxID=2587813 RepID=UPI001390F178|nr:anchored repeat-type ABC transporter ATP-binding subunit [Nesterenkonia haasae]NDK33148.1 anchored repeat-type ABC transporter ATP-binding subunit [Nesterenkonia haasae]
MSAKHTVYPEDLREDEAAHLDEGLQVEGLAVDLGGRPVLRNVDLNVAAGELVGLIGPNGAGKTTLIRSVLGLTPSREGHVRVEGQSSRKARRRIGYVPQRQEFAWDFPISVHDVVLSGRVGAIGWLRRAGVQDYQAVAEALDRADMSSLKDRPVGQLSGGQRQRVLVARALALRPQVMLLDEPFTGLDIPTQELLTDLFRDLAAEGRALLMTTHDLAGAMHTFDRLYLINRTVVASGPPDALRSTEIWTRAFGFRQDSPLLNALGVKDVKDGEDH